MFNNTLANSRMRDAEPISALRPEQGARTGGAPEITVALALVSDSIDRLEKAAGALAEKLTAVCAGPSPDPASGETVRAFDTYLGREIGDRAYRLDSIARCLEDVYRRCAL